MDWLNNFKKVKLPELSNYASAYLGPEAVLLEKGIDLTVDHLTQRMVSVCSMKDGSRKLCDLSAKLAEELPSPVSECFSNGMAGIARLLNFGSAVLNLLMKNDTSEFSTSVAGAAGIRESEASSLVKMTAAILLQSLGEELKEKEWTHTELCKNLGILIPQLSSLGTDPFRSAARSLPERLEDRGTLPDMEEGGQELLHKLQVEKKRNPLCYKKV